MKYLYIVLLFVLISCKTPAFEAACEVNDDNQSIDYVSELKFKQNSESLKCEVTVKSFIDGDTVHFYVPKEVSESGVLKARFLAINTPEITGLVEKWGKRAATFTKERLKNATSIWIESDNSSWNLDSTGSRTLVWVWYKCGDEEYKSLNLELLQEGLALPSNAKNNRYGSFCEAAVKQARGEKRYVFSNDKDPDFFEGDALELTVKELRVNSQRYESKRVAFEAVVIRNYNNNVYVEGIDDETSLPFGMSIYCGYALPGEALDILRVGNRVRVVGSMQYYESGERYQISGLQYRVMRPNDPLNIRLISTNEEIVWKEITLESLYKDSVTILLEDEYVTLPLSKALIDSAVSIDALSVEEAYSLDDSSLILVCSSNGYMIKIRVLFKSNLDSLVGKTISIRGVVDSYNNEPQIMLFREDDIKIY